jgi:hypothetical protein
MQALQTNQNGRVSRDKRKRRPQISIEGGNYDSIRQSTCKKRYLAHGRTRRRRNPPSPHTSHTHRARGGHLHVSRNNDDHALRKNIVCSARALEEENIFYSPNEQQTDRMRSDRDQVMHDHVPAITE